MVGMNTFDPAQHPRAANGEFTQKRNSAPAGGLSASSEATSAVELTGRTRTFRPELSATEITLHEVRAARDLPEHGVKAGDAGGWVESLHLADGTPRVADTAWLGAGAEVYDNA